MNMGGLPYYTMQAELGIAGEMQWESARSGSSSRKGLPEWGVLLKARAEVATEFKGFYFNSP